MRKIRVAFFSGDITRSGGTERVAALLANQLQLQKKYQIMMVSLTQEKELPLFMVSSDIPRIVLSRRWMDPGLGYLWICHRLVRLIRRRQIDVLVDVDGVLDLLAVPAKFFTGVRVISWQHFSYYQDREIWYRRLALHLASRYTDAAVVLNQENQKDLQRHYHWKVPLEVIPNPMGYMTGAKLPLHHQAGQPWHLLSVGGLEERKGFLDIPEIAQSICEHYPELPFLWKIYGEGSQREELERKIQQHHMESRIQLCGVTDHMEEVYAEADIYVMTSRWEGLPMVLLEAKMYCLPIVSYQIKTGPAQLIRNGENGYLISLQHRSHQSAIEEMAQKIGGICSKEKRWQQMTQKSQLGMERYRMDTVLSQWLELLDQIDERGSRRKLCHK